MFAKLFNSPNGDQVLVRLITGSDDRPSVTFSFEGDPDEELSNVIDVALSFTDWDAAQVCFDAQDEYTTAKVAETIRADIASDQPLGTTLSELAA